MPVLSPAAYDALLLEKVKLLLEAAMLNPRRRGPPSTYEAFVEGLDIRDDSSLRAFEVLLYETTTRRPRKVRRTDAGPVASTSTAAVQPGLRRMRRAQSDLDLHSGYEYVPAGEGFASSDSESSESDADIVRPFARRRALPRPVGVPDDGSWSRWGAPWPSATEPTAAEQRLSDDLFGSADGPSISQVLANLDTSGGRTALSMLNMPTFEELWGILVDDPFPSARITSFPSFLAELNASSFSVATFTSHDLPTLLYDLTQRDPALPIRVANTVRARSRSTAATRTHRASPLRQTTLLERAVWGRRQRGLDVMQDAREDAAAAWREEEEDDSPLREGIWRAAFVEHLPDGTARDVPVDLGALPASAGDAGEDVDFVEFARERRALRRATVDGLVARRDQRAAELRALEMEVDDAPAAGGSAGTTPAIMLTMASTPATSVAHSPPPASAACPAPAPAPAPSAAPRTSASIAEAHFRAQRPVVPLRASPSHADALAPVDGVNPGMRAVVEALQRARNRRSLAPEEEEEGLGREMR
ncbi:hypothetical protein JCM10450v2_001065 [Rhodotorula kratochvilovae]